MASTGQLFDTASSISRFWLPPLLDNLATLPPTLCEGEGCSIFLVWHDHLYLAATTRRGLKERIFGDDTSYHIDPEVLRAAEEDYRREADHPTWRSGLTGWVAAFNRPMRITDLRKGSELDALADSATRIPRPVWSNRSRGFYDWEGPRPFMAVPMRHADDVKGVVRVSTIRSPAQPFTIEQQQKLQEFADQLADFLMGQQLLSEGLEHYFRLWAAQDGEVLARRISRAVPQLFSVDCCSFFHRDSEGRFVLRQSAAAEKLEGDAKRHFEDFRRANLGNLYYQADRSKTGQCILHQAPLLLKRNHKTNQWESEMGKVEMPLEEESSGSFLEEREDDLPHCELDPRQSRAILLVPIRDTINPRRLAGILRVVSTDAAQLDERVFRELAHFASGFAHYLGETTREEIERGVYHQLIRRLGKPTEASELWRTAAEVAAQALEADAVTIFRMEQETLVSEADHSYLNQELIRRDLPLDEFQKEKQQFQRFCAVLRDQAYRKGDGRTGWPAKHGRVLNLKDLTDTQELERLKVECKEKPPDIYCEISNPGPFIAAPISLDPDAEVDGVVRALRRRRSPRGPFSVAHELILSAVGTRLAGLSRLLPQPTPAVVISYCGTFSHYKEELVRFLTAMGVRALALDAAMPATNPIDSFDELIGQASAAIVLCTPDQETRRARGVYLEPSANVTAELVQLSRNLPGRVAVIKERSVTLPEMSVTPDYQLQFVIETDIHPVLIELAELLRKWLWPPC